LVHALAMDPARLLEATRDWLHQSYREPAMPRSYELMKRLRGNGFAAVISGAGPSVLVLGRVEDLQALATEVVPGFSLRLLALGHGARVIG
jgi:homoserine kinase